MKRVMLIALLVTAIAAPLAAQDATKALDTAKKEWEWCVQTTHSLLGQPERDEVYRRSERAFAGCTSEEELFLATIDLAFSESGRRQARLLHFRNKLALKTKLTEDDFKAIARSIGKQ